MAAIPVSAADQAKIDTLKQQYDKARREGNLTAMDFYHRQAEQVRAQYGYSGGSDGSEVIPLAPAAAAPAAKPAPAATATAASYTAKGTYNDAGLPEADAAKIAALKQQYERAKAAGDMDAANAAHTAAEQLRAQYGYSGGGDGSEYLPVGNTVGEAVAQGVTFPSAYQPQKLATPTSQADYVDALYRAQQRQALAALKTAYDRNVLTLDAAAGRIPALYKAAREDSERQALLADANFHEYAAANGLGSGAGTQAALSRSIAAQQDAGEITRAETEAKRELAAQRLQVQTQYQNDIAAAAAAGDLEKARALYEEAVRVDNGLVKAAKEQADELYRAWQSRSAVQSGKNDYLQAMADTLAAHGDFSGYRALGYTEGQIAQMQADYDARAGGRRASSSATSSASSSSGGGTKPKTESQEAEPAETEPAASLSGTATMSEAARQLLRRLHVGDMTAAAQRELISGAQANGLISEQDARLIGIVMGW